MRERRILRALGAAIILAYFFFFTWKSLFLYFDQDDMLNLYGGWNRPLGELIRGSVLFWTGAYRPLGMLVYRGVFAVAGFHPLPLHAVVLALGVVNIGLCFWFTRMVSGSESTAAFAALLFAFHTRLMEIWFRTAVMYDVLCFTFLYIAVCLYISARRKSGAIGAWRTAAIVLCFICALDAKEMAVCLPVLLLAYEAIYQRWQTGIGRRAALLGAFALMAVVYAFGKLHGADSMANNPGYTPSYTWARWGDTWSLYLRHLFVLNTGMPRWAAMAILCGMLAVALAARSRHLIFAWVVLFAGLAPVSFVPTRGAFVLYIAWMGWCLYGAVVLSAAATWIGGKLPRYATAIACAIFLLAGWRMGKLNLHDQRSDARRWLYDPPNRVRATAVEMRALQPSFPADARILFMHDAFPGDWTTLFIVRLVYKDRNLIADLADLTPAKPAAPDEYGYVFTWNGRSVQQLKPVWP